MYSETQNIVMAEMLDLPFPRFFNEIVCEGALFVNHLWADGYTPKMSCGNPKPTDNTAIIAKHVVLGYDAAHITFQHDMITGISHASVFAEYLERHPSSSVVLCQKTVRTILAAWLGAERVLERSAQPKLFWAPSVRWSRAPSDLTLEGCEPFPLGSFWPVEIFLRQQQRFKGLSRPNRPRILFLSRGGSGSSAQTIRYIDNESELVEMFQKLCELHNWTFDFLAHQATAIDDQTTQTKTVSQFFAADAVVGLHGGAFSNIVFCNSKAVIVEINNNVNGRMCFSGIAVSRGLDYHRFQPRREFFYQSWDHFALAEREMHQIVAITYHKVAQARKLTGLPI